ncbi:MAG: O-antigen ligase family protein [Clostridiales bacterium]|nr:O-antigen ligase family protein [Clostridiales bacterium]
MKEKFQKIVESKFGTCADKFCNSIWYIVVMGAACVLSHSFDIPVVGAALLTLLLVPALLFCKNSFVLMPFLMMCSFVLSEKTKPDTGYYNTPARIAVLCILLVFIVIALLFNLIYYGKWKCIFKKSYLTVSLALLTGALLMGGIGAKTFSFGGVGTAIAIAAATILPYALLLNCGQYEGRKTVVYFAWAVIVAALAIGICYLKQYIINDFNLQTYVKGYLALGFVGPNTGAAIVTLALPMTFYLVYIYKRGFLFMLLVALELFIIVASFSRASLVVAVPGTIIVAVALCFKKKEGRRGYLIAFCIAVAAALVFCIVFRHKIYSLLMRLFNRDFTGSGRTRLWKRGFNAFTDNPVFGVGLGFLPFHDYWYYSFHCTPLTYLFCGGIVGFLAYAYHRYRTARLVFSAKLTTERVFTALTVFAMLCNALLDIAMTSPTHLLYYGIMLALIECDAKQAKAQTSPQTKAQIKAGEGVNNSVDGGEVNENISAGEV